jgi:excinuclease ABC subunit B
MEIKRFKLQAPYSPKGDQPLAIEALSKNLLEGIDAQVLLGITGSGKTFTIANVIERVQKPTLIIAHNKTLAAQLYQEFKAFFPDNAVEYFVSYYDYYQPEAYIARTDTYIEKDMAINDRIDRMRLSATRSLLERRDVIIIASVSCIYGLGSPEYYSGMHLQVKKGGQKRRDDLLLHLVEMQYKRNDYDFQRATFRVRGDVVDIFPAYEEEKALRIEFFGDDIEALKEFDPLTGKVIKNLEEIHIYPSSHHVTPEEVRAEARETILKELKEREAYFEENNKLIELQRIGERTRHDLEMIKEVGFCKGIENYSRHFSKKKEGEPPPTLIDYFPKEDFLLVVDESHQTIPQMHAMYHGDRSRKETLVGFGFRLPSAFDNRPMRFEESYAKFPQTIYVSATPAPFEIQEAQGRLIEQVIRPTGLLDPEIEIRKATGQVDDCLEEIRMQVKLGHRILVTTLTKKLSEELTNYLLELNIKAKYLHSDIDTLERMQIIYDLRAGGFDVLVGINLLREGLDIPEVSLVLILDADKQGFLRSKTSLIQTCGRAARNAKGRVILYADQETEAIRETVKITQERRAKQKIYNAEHGIIPQTVLRAINPLVEETQEIPSLFEKEAQEMQHSQITLKQVRAKIKTFEKEMKKAASALKFDEAAKYRDLMLRYQKIELDLS